MNADVNCIQLAQGFVNTITNFRFSKGYVFLEQRSKGLIFKKIPSP
jgi:hypothetical protein